MFGISKKKASQLAFIYGNYLLVKQAGTDIETIANSASQLNIVQNETGVFMVRDDILSADVNNLTLYNQQKFGE